MLVLYTEGQGQRLGLVIDLTKTDRYYDKRTLTDERGIGHYKLQCEGWVLSHATHTHTPHIGLERPPQQSKWTSLREFARISSHNILVK